MTIGLRRTRALIRTARPEKEGRRTVESILRVRTGRGQHDQAGEASNFISDPCVCPLQECERRLNVGLAIAHRPQVAAARNRKVVADQYRAGDENDPTSRQELTGADRRSRLHPREGKQPRSSLRSSRSRRRFSKAQRRASSKGKTAKAKPDPDQVGHEAGRLQAEAGREQGRFRQGTPRKRTTGLAKPRRWRHTRTIRRQVPPAPHIMGSLYDLACVHRNPMQATA